MEKNDRIFVAGGTTFVGNAISKQLKTEGYTNLVCRPGEEPDLTDADQVDAFFARTSPEYIFLVAGKSGGIRANQKYPAEFIYDNAIITIHVLQSAYRHSVRKLLYLASSCSYPRRCRQPMRVEDLMTGPLEPTNEAYAMAKLLGIKMCEAYHNQYSVTFVPAIASNPFGPGDDFDPDDSHVIAALIRRMHEAKIHDAEVVEIWGTGSPRREFIYCDDLADACIFVMREYNSTEPINLGTGFDLSIRELAEMVKKVVGFGGELIYNASKPDGMMRKVLDSSRLREMGWKPRTSFQAALSATYDWFLHGESQAVRSIE